MGKITGYAGTYASQESLGIYRFALDEETGTLDPPALICEAPDAKYLSLRDGLLAAPVAREQGAGVLLLSPGQGAGREALHESAASCYVDQDENRVYTANFHEGMVLVYEKPALSLIGRMEVAPKAGCHQVLFHKDFLLVPCLELDCVRLFHRETFVPAGEIPFPHGSGPRHGVFNRAHTRLFMAGQRSFSVYCLRVEKTGFRMENAFSALPGPGGAGDETAAIRLSADERFLYVSTRGADIITVFRVTDGGLEPLQYAPSGGKHPRDFLLSGNGRFLLAANRFAGGIVSFARDRATGKLGSILGRASLPQAVSLALDE